MNDAAPIGPKKVLLVDDESSFLMLTRHILESQGWSVVTAENGEEGLKQLASAKFDIVISDVYMPVMDGLKFHRSVRAIPEYAELPFLFVSAFDDMYTLSAIAASKCDGFLRKGRPAAELKEWVVYLTTPADKRGTSPMAAASIRSDRSASHVPLRDSRNTHRGDGTSR